MHYSPEVSDSQSAGAFVPTSISASSLAQVPPVRAQTDAAALWQHQQLQIMHANMQVARRDGHLSTVGPFQGQFPGEYPVNQPNQQVLFGQQQFVDPTVISYYQQQQQMANMMYPQAMWVNMVGAGPSLAQQGGNLHFYPPRPDPKPESSDQKEPPEAPPQKSRTNSGRAPHVRVHSSCFLCQEKLVTPGGYCNRCCVCQSQDDDAMGIRTLTFCAKCMEKEETNNAVRGAIDSIPNAIDVADIMGKRENGVLKLFCCSKVDGCWNKIRRSKVLEALRKPPKKRHGKSSKRSNVEIEDGSV